MTTTRGRWALVGGMTALALVAAAVLSPTASAGDAAACSGRDLSARVTGNAAGVSQPAAYITVTNTSARTCTVRGYPTITRARTKKGRQPITVTNGAVMNAPQNKPRTIAIAPGGHAWFAVGAATAYDPPVVTFVRLTFSPSGNGTRTVRLRLPASAPTGKPFPLGVTAFAPGVGIPD
jgi:hypothetical protein